MKRLSVLFIAVMLAGAAYAQGANPMSEHYKGQWMNIRDLRMRMADKMPNAEYRFNPTPEVQDFGQRMAHVVAFNMRACSALQGAQKNPDVFRGAL